MALRTAEQYIESLRDRRTVYFRGQRVADVTTHPVIAVAVNHAAIDYRLAEEPRHRTLCIVNDGDGDYSRYYQIPRTPEDLLQRSALIERVSGDGPMSCNSAVGPFGDFGCMARDMRRHYDQHPTKGTRR